MKCPKCDDGCQGNLYVDPKSKVEKLNICANCRYALNGHKKMAKPMPQELKNRES